MEASSLLTDGAIKPHSIDLVATSRPYLQVVNYGTANWIRLWLPVSTKVAATRFGAADRGAR